MPVQLILISGVTLVGAFVFCAIACLSRCRRVIMETEARRGQTGIISLERAVPAEVPGRTAMSVEPALPETFTGLNMRQAEELLDWLEANGHRNCEVSYEERTGFTVRLH
jgi:hypothetical protein